MHTYSDQNILMQISMIHVTMDIDSQSPVTLDGLDLLLKRTDGKNILIMRSLKRLDMEHKRRNPDQHAKNSFERNGKDMGRHASKIIIEGDIMGERAHETTGELRKKYINGKPVEFVSKLSLEYGINKVMIEELNINSVKGRPYHFQYGMHLVEYIEYSH
jgi:hypothetical protein